MIETRFTETKTLTVPFDWEDGTKTQLIFSYFKDKKSGNKWIIYRAK